MQRQGARCLRPATRGEELRLVQRRPAHPNVEVSKGGHPSAQRFFKPACLGPHNALGMMQQMLHSGVHTKVQRDPEVGKVAPRGTSSPK
jgi:hypothetical protein